MLCDNCHKNSATIHLTEVVEDKASEIHLCPSCAASKTNVLKEKINIPDSFYSLIDSDIKKEDSALKCLFCGLTYADFKKNGRLGCGNCYTVFKAGLSNLLKKIHGSAKHCGKNPLPLNEKEKSVLKTKELHERLARAIQIEEYEEAARLRDVLNALEVKNKK